MLLGTGAINVAAGTFGDVADRAIANVTPPQQGNAQRLQSSGQHGSSPGVSRPECFTSDAAAGLPEEHCPARDSLGAHSRAPQDSERSRWSTDKPDAGGMCIAVIPRTRTTARSLVPASPRDTFIRPSITLSPPSLLPKRQALPLDSCATPRALKSRTRVSPPGGNEGIPRT